MTAIHPAFGNGHSYASEKTYLLTHPPPLIEKNKEYSVDPLDELQNELKIKKIGWRRYLGLILGLAAACFFSLTTLMARLLNDYDPFNKALWRFQGIFLPSIPIIFHAVYYKKTNVVQEIFPLDCRERKFKFFLLLVRAFCGWAMVMCKYFALFYISVGDVTVISLCSPVFVTILAFIFLKEKCGVIPLFAAFLTVIGIGVISKPPILTGAEEIDANTIIGVLFALGCMTFACITYITLRWLKDVHHGVIAFSYGFYSSIFSLIAYCFTGVFELPDMFVVDWFYAIGLASFAFFAQLLFTLSLRYEEAGPISCIRTTEVIFAFIWQMMFLAEFPDALSVIGAILLLASVLITAGRKWFLDLPEKKQPAWLAKIVSM